MKKRAIAGTVGGWPKEPEGEELVVVSGQAKIGSRGLLAGDYVETLPNDLHRVEALVVTLLFVRQSQIPIHGIVSKEEEEGDIE